jgi:hypothetical protein
VLLVGRLGYLLGGAAVMRTTVALAAALALGIFTVPPAGDAQQATKLWRVGHLGYAYPTAAKDLEASRHRLRDLGYVEGKNLVIESRSAESGFERLPELAAELVGLKVDVIAAFGNGTIMALKQATPTISWLRAAADDSALVDRGQKNTERMLRALLGALGFEHVKVVFEEPPKT